MEQTKEQNQQQAGKIRFQTEDGTYEELFVLEQTKLNGINYLLVTDSEEEEAECYIFKETSEAEGTEAVYEPVEDETELNSLLAIFEQLLDDVEFIS
ncbi:MAG: DUF1292 domain-containing protein [Clostridiales bacterium]|nr:DUF1292 domain-containing protein [Clostridiales bacterium]